MGMSGKRVRHATMVVAGAALMGVSLAACDGEMGLGSLFGGEADEPGSVEATEDGEVAADGSEAASEVDDGPTTEPEVRTEDEETPETSDEAPDRHNDGADEGTNGAAGDEAGPSDTDPEDGRSEGSDDDALADKAVRYFLDSQDICDAHAEEFGNQPPDPDRFRNVALDEVLDGERVVIVDGTGTRLLVDLRATPPVIHDPAGPDEILPPDLSFGCPPELYLGSLPA